jgi:hypothetical protein
LYSYVPTYYITIEEEERRREGIWEKMITRFGRK